MSILIDTGKSSIRVKEIVWEAFQDYKLPSMLLAMCFCDWKCLKEKNLDISICQNCQLAKSKTIEITISELFYKYTNNKITKAIIFGGLEPFLQFDEVLSFIDYFRINNCKDDIIIYTGYYPEEKQTEIDLLSKYKNIIVKFGRFEVNSTPIFDNVLGINLASKNQFAKIIDI
jgi:hypothetical protein